MSPFLILLDDMLSGKSEWKVLKYIRTISSRCVIILTVCRRLNQKITGFHQGTDDYYEGSDRYKRDSDTTGIGVSILCQ